jgi:hypothetical protein
MLLLDFGLHGPLGHCRHIQEDSSFQCGSKILKEYQRCVKKAMFIISLNLADNQLAHLKSCKRRAGAWKTFCNIHEAKILSNIIFVCRKFFTYKIQDGNDLLKHINNVKTFVDQLAYLKVLVHEKKTLMTLLNKLLTL